MVKKNGHNKTEEIEQTAPLKSRYENEQTDDGYNGNRTGLGRLVQVDELQDSGSLADELLKWKKKLLESIPRANITEFERAYSTQLFYEELQVSGKRKKGQSYLMAAMAFNLELTTAVGGYATKNVVTVLSGQRQQDEKRSWWQKFTGLGKEKTYAQA
jgi:hypothetical protein